MKVVMAAVVEKDGKYMICRRGPGRRLEGVWEFPGGKLEAGETPEEGLARELREELKIETEIGQILDAQLESEFHEFIILYYRARIISGEPALTEHSEINMCAPQSSCHMSFLPPMQRRLSGWRACNFKPHF